MITAVPGVRVGHVTDTAGRTGCTVVLLPAGTVASGEVRGGAPGTREWALLDPRRTVDRVDAVVLAGGSAFGLAACDGVVRWCEERGIGWPTTAGPVPIVVGMVVYDLNVGDPRARPDDVAGYAACVGALAGEEATGHGGVGAGAGATIGKWRGPGSARPAGLGSAVIRHGDVTVAALVVANAIGEPRRPDDALRLPPALTEVTPGSGDNNTNGENTTIGVVVTDARLDKQGCLHLAEAAHDGLARAVDPVHTGADGDAFVVAATGRAPANIQILRSLSAHVVEQAFLDACRP
ncbi:MAG TPA: P1 family peptidase [Acidimicrobiales bacterium]|nr:P1 family peptidase [Acidimicrobiales bacterium]